MARPARDKEVVAKHFLWWFRGRFGDTFVVTFNQIEHFNISALVLTTNKGFVISPKVKFIRMGEEENNFPIENISFYLIIEIFQRNQVELMNVNKKEKQIKMLVDLLLH